MDREREWYQINIKIGYGTFNEKSLFKFVKNPFIIFILFSVKVRGFVITVVSYLNLQYS